MKKLFDYTVITTEEQDYKDICSSLKEMAVSSRDIIITNYYMEMPVATKTRLIASTENSFVVYPTDFHLRVLSEKQKTIISMNSKQTILANCQAISSRSCEAVLSGFRYISLYSDQRESCRIRLMKPMSVSLLTDKGKLAGVLKDISMGGCRLSIFMKELEPGEKATLVLKMYDQDTKMAFDIAIEALLVRQNNQNMPVECGFCFSLDKAAEKKLTQFINQRQMEIIKFLRQHAL